MFRIRTTVLIAAIVAGGLGAVVPATAEAQFAGVPRAPRRRPPAEAVASGADSARRDTLPPTRLPDMKAWVDSATIALGAAGGSSVGAPAPAAPLSPTTSAPAGRAAGDSAMRDGARAPDTATPLPSLALAGSLLVAVGLFVRRRAASRG